jgi:enoyl-[acyl-carrier-protein] reductase (NADH)
MRFNQKMPVGIANNRSIAWGIAQQLHKAGANLGTICPMIGVGWKKSQNS